MFQGFTDETFDFLTAISFNNNTDFFHANHDWYLRAVRKPCLLLAEALSGAIEVLDASIERRPNRVVSRINRDLRYARDKSPYRDLMWLSFHRPAGERYTAPELYFEINARGASYGMGFYEEDRARMNGLRRRMLTEPDAFLDLWAPLSADHALYLNAFKRMKLPETLRPELTQIYPVRSFYVSQSFDDFAVLKSPALVDTFTRVIERYAPFYRYIAAVVPEPDEARLNPGTADQ